MSHAQRWLEEHGDALYRYAMLRLGDPDSAQDAVQETLLAAMQGEGTFEGRSKERTWLIGILRHKVLDILRRRARSIQPDDPMAFEKGHGRTAPVHWHRVEDESERRELRRLLYDRIRDLPEMQRLALCLRELDGMKTEEVCKILGITPTNLWTLIHRAKLRLREDLSRRWFGEDTR